MPIKTKKYDTTARTGDAALLGRIAAAAEELYFANRSLAARSKSIMDDLRKKSISENFTRVDQEAAKVNEASAKLLTYIDAALRMGIPRADIDETIDDFIGIHLNRER